MPLDTLSDIAIARAATLLPMGEIGAKIGLPPEAVLPYGRDKAKIDLDAVPGLDARPRGKLVLVTAINPTPAGEGKTTTTVGLGDGLQRRGKRAVICLREPSLGPCFGVKGGAAGGGRAQIVPMEDINLHFTGDFHAITSAHNLLAAMVDNHLYWGNALGLDPRRIAWRRVLDMNDRALRQIVLGLGGPAQGVPREGGFDITVASEVMAILCLATDREDLLARLGRIVVAETHDRRPVTAAELKAHEAMAVLLKDALLPNLVQTMEHCPALVHGGPFANIAHGCNSVIATRAALALGDYVVTEAGFGADLGAEKFFDIKCRQAGLAPDAVVLVATIRALKTHGDVPLAELGRENVDAVEHGLVNLGRHIENLSKFGVPMTVAVNRFGSDTPDEIEAVLAFCRDRGVHAHLAAHWAEGSAGVESLADEVIRLAEGGAARFKPLYADELPLRKKIETVAREIYRASEVTFAGKAEEQLKRFEQQGAARFPVCIAKTQSSFSADPKLKGAPVGHVLPVREVRLLAGAGFVTAICGDIMTMPGLPKSPAAERIGFDAEGRVEGLF
jgi:formate--tetrahydrofolate ligase